MIIDEGYFIQKDALLKVLDANGINRDAISVLIYKGRLKRNEATDQLSFSLKDVNWSGEINNPGVIDFQSRGFDLLISYYDIEKAPLLAVTQQTKADFKVGFASIDKRLNHFMINANAMHYKVFATELFKYLKILNKI